MLRRNTSRNDIVEALWMSLCIQTILEYLHCDNHEADSLMSSTPPAHNAGYAEVRGLQLDCAWLDALDGPFRTRKGRLSSSSTIACHTLVHMQNPIADQHHPLRAASIDSIKLRITWWQWHNACIDLFVSGVNFECGVRNNPTVSTRTARLLLSRSIHVWNSIIYLANVSMGLLIAAGCRSSVSSRASHRKCTRSSVKAGCYRQHSVELQSSSTER
jgi:hypothetical protein